MLHPQTYLHRYRLLPYLHMSKHRRYAFALLSLLLLGLGAVIYIYMRQDIIFVQNLPFEFSTQIPKEVCYGSPRYLLIYCLPDALWYAALLLCQLALMPNNVVGKVILSTAIISPFVLELGQLVGSASGTFDVLDMLSYLFVLIIFILWYRKSLNRSYRQEH